MELRGSCTNAQLAKYIGTDVRIVNRRIQFLLKRGQLDYLKPKQKSPHTIPETGILLAKTCILCGEFLSASKFSKASNSFRKRNECNKCIRNNQSDSTRQRVNASRQIWQKITKEEAYNNGAEWTSSDYELVADNNKSNLELAIALGRSYSAISNARFKIGATRHANDNIGPWIINFPEIQDKLQQEFIRLGIPDDGWN